MERELDFRRIPDGGAIDLDAFKRKSWPQITALFVRIAAPVTFDFKFKTESNCIILRDLYRVDGETIVPGRTRSATKDLRGKLAFFPAGSDVEGWTRIEKASSLVLVRIGSDVFDRGAGDSTQLAPMLDIDDHTLRLLMLRFQALLDDPSLDIPGYAETLAKLLTFEVTRTSRNASSNRAEAKFAQRGLTAGQLRLVTDYMSGHLKEKITISELAALVGLNRFHFMRAFKQSTGMPPLQFIIRQRVERATALLNESGASIAEVADRCGFGSPIQMTRSFRRVAGATPSAIRRGN
jgi:AraC family transcriptional regulator